jgi:hypothetical protein
MLKIIINIFAFIFITASVIFAQEIGCVIADTIILSELVGASCRCEEIFPLGDIDHDGFDDFIVEAYPEKSILFYGDPTLNFHRKVMFRRFVNWVNVGDVNDDGWDDLLAGNPFWMYLSYLDPGYVDLFLGSYSFDTIPDWEYSPLRDYEHFGSRIVSVGDDNSDGFSDFIVVGPQPAWEGDGIVYLFYGSPTVPNLKKTWEGGILSFFGLFCYVGDFDGNGKKDILAQKGNCEIDSIFTYYVIWNNDSLSSQEPRFEVETPRIDPYFCPFSYPVYSNTSAWPKIQNNLISYDYDEDGKDEVINSSFYFDYNDSLLNVSRHRLAENMYIFLEKPSFSFTQTYGHSNFCVVKWVGDSLDTLYCSPRYLIPFSYLGDCNGDGYTEIALLDTLFTDTILVASLNPASITEITQKPIELSLEISPNPTNSSISIKYSVLKNSNTFLFLMDINGRKIKSIALEGSNVNGTNSVIIDTKEMSTGVYFVVLECEGQRVSKRCLVLK